MAGVTIKELGLSFVKVCMEQYWGNCMFPLLFLGMLIGILVRYKDRTPRIFLYETIFLMLTVYNPILVKAFIPKLDFENEYYRFIWILPVIPGVAYFAARLVFAVKNRIAKAGMIIVLAVVIVVTGTPVQGVVKDFALAENLYKVPDDLRAVCDVIHSDSEKENPRVVFDNALNPLARQYDPSLQLILERNIVLYCQGSTVVGSFNEESSRFKRHKIIMDVLFFQSDEVEVKTFKKALYRTETDYVVVPVNNTKHDFVKEAGCEALAQTQNYVVYRFDWENAYKKKK